MNDRFDLSGRVAIVTGSGRGLGRALAKGLAVAGAAVVVCDRDDASAGEVAAELTAAGHRALPAHVDVAERDSCASLMDLAVRKLGRLDVLVNNAAIDAIEPLHQVTPAHWDRILGIDLTGAFHCSQLAAVRMAARKSGSIVNVSSIASAVGIPGLVAYSAAKGGLNQLTRAMAVELARDGVRVNAVAPGYLENRMADTEAAHADPAKETQIRARTPLGRRARLDEIVGPVIFLASDAASYVTGTVIFVDGGWTAA